MGIFAWLGKRGKEPSSPRKIGIGMVIASFGFVLVLIASLGLVSPKDMAGAAVGGDRQGFALLADEFLSHFNHC